MRAHGEKPVYADELAPCRIQSDTVKTLSGPQNCKCCSSKLLTKLPPTGHRGLQAQQQVQCSTMKYWLLDNVTL